MIASIGIESIQVSAMEALCQSKGDTFIENHFAPMEIEYCQTKRYSFQHYAARYAAKKAFFQAFDEAMASSIGWNELFITHDQLGRPLLQFSSSFQEWIKNRQIQNIHVSLSHTKETAIAIVVLEK